MKLHLYSSIELISSAEKAVKEERLSTIVVIDHLREIEKRKLYRKFGYSSLFAMVTEKFGYSEASAQRRINAMRLVRDLPETKDKIENGELSLTSAASVHSYFRQTKIAVSEKRNVIDACLNKTTREVEKELASRDPEQDKREVIRYSKSDRLRMSINISENIYAQLESSKYKKGFRTVEELLQYFLDEDKKAEAVVATPAPETRYISKITKAIVKKRNEAKTCEYRDPETNERCPQTQNLQFDHQIPFSKGGPNITENLRQLCGPHNRYAWHHEQK